jgi:cytidylate kinase
MKIADSVLVAHLRNVLWIGGGACGGKTTITDLLADKYGFTAYHPEDYFQQHKEAACYQDHPAMLRPFLGWEWYFNRPIDEYAAAIMEADREHFEWVIVDLIKMGESGTVVVDGHMLDPVFLKRIASHNKVVFLFADEATIRKSFFAREDKQDILRVINSLQNPETAREHLLDVTCEVSARKRVLAKSSGLQYMLRDQQLSIEATLRMVEEHFCIAGLEVS